MAKITIEVDESDLNSVLGMAQSYNDDLESGLEDGTYEEGDADENKSAIASVEDAIRVAKKAMRISRSRR